MDTSAQDILLEPCDAYNQVYEASFKDNANKLFYKLLEESGVDVDANRKSAAEYRKSQAETNDLNKKLKRQKTFRILLILAMILGAILAIAWINAGETLMAVIAGVVAVAALLVMLLVVNPKIKELKAAFSTSSETTDNLLNSCKGQIAPLLGLFESTMSTDLIKETVPTLDIDRNYDMRRFDYLQGKYGYPEEDGEDSSMVGIMSGEIIGNPFVFERKLKHHWGTQTYHGSLTIHWTTTRVEDGKTITEHHSETLYASVTKPKPFFNTFTDLIYGNEAAPDLSFSRELTHADKMSEKKLDKYVKSKSKEIKKLAKKNIDKGFTELGNEEFDALWGATDRDHEVQFRMLFTPLAQKNLLRIIKGGSPYGDDFYFTKRKCINILASEHSQDRPFNIEVSSYYSYDVDICRENFISINADYFKSIFFDFAPVLSIPMYQQIKPHEYIYSTSYNRNYTVREAEVIANRMSSRLKHPSSVTPAIIKTSLLGKNGDVDSLSAHAFSYRTVNRVDFIPVHGGDGHWHDVPVPWLQYILLQQDTKLELKSLNMGEREYARSSYADDDDAHTFFHSIFATLGEVEASNDENPGAVSDDLRGLSIDEG